MKNIQKTISALEIAEKYLDRELADPNKGPFFREALEIMSWNIRKNRNELQEEKWREPTSLH